MEASVPSLTYHNHMEFVWEALRLCSKVFDPMTVADERLIAVCQKTVIQLIAHPISDVRWQAYKASLRLAKEAFSVSHVTEPMSTICQKSLFLLERAVLYQICCFGIYDENDKVGSPCIVYGNAVLLFFFDCWACFKFWHTVPIIYTFIIMSSWNSWLPINSSFKNFSYFKFTVM